MNGVNSYRCLAGISAAVTDSLGPSLVCPKEFSSRQVRLPRPVVPREVAEGVLDSSSSLPLDVETGDAGEWPLPLALLVKAQRKEPFMVFARLIC